MPLYPNDIDPLEEDLHTAVARDFRTLVEAASRATDAPDTDEGWNAVESAIVALFRHIEYAIADGGKCRQERAFRAIENALKQRRKRWKRAQTELRRFYAVVRLEGVSKGPRREQALKNIGLTENSIKQYAGPVRAAVRAALKQMIMSGKLGPYLKARGVRPRPKPIPYAGKERRRARRARSTL